MPKILRGADIFKILYEIYVFNNFDVGRLRFELRTSRLKAGCSTAELATHYVILSTLKIIPF